MKYYSDDPVEDYNRYCDDQQAELERMPICEDCHEHIQSEDAYYINDCWICEDCISSYKREVQPEY